MERECQRKRLIETKRVTPKCQRGRVRKTEREREVIETS